jgi:hypothetical protein
MELGKKYGTQLGAIHVLELSLMVLFKKKQKKGSTLGKFDERVKDVLFVFDAECRKCK